MSTWWLWRVGRGQPKVTKTFDLPWPYVRDVNRRTMERYELEQEMRDQVMPAVRRPGKTEEWHRMDAGSMTTVNIKQRGVGGKTFVLTPPLTTFVDVSKFFPESRAVKNGWSEFFVQPEVYRHTGEFFIGRLGELIPMTWADVKRHADEEMTGFIMAALDAFLEKGDVADPRFLKPHHLGRRLRDVVRLDREISAALTRPRRK